MPTDSTALPSVAWLLIGAALFVRGGLRFRRWAVEDRIGVPRFSPHAETIMLWLVYSGAVSVAIVVVKQVIRQV